MTNPSNLFYNLEIQQKETCTPEYNTNKTVDLRYKNAGFEIDQYTLLTQLGSSHLGVYGQLTTKTDYYRQVPDYANVKKNAMTFVWSKPTTPWSLECEKQNNTRQSFTSKQNKSQVEILSGIIS